MGGKGSGGNQALQHDGSQRDGLPSKPTDLSDDVSIVWDSLLKQIPASILRSADCYQLETLAKLLVQGRALSSSAMADPGDAGLNRVWLANGDLVRKLSACFGLSPTDRKRMAIVDEPDADDPFLEMLARRNGTKNGN